MKLYLIKQHINTNYDTFDSAVVAAKNEEEARTLHPSEYATHLEGDKWMGTYPTGNTYVYDSTDWIRPSQLNQLEVIYLGTAAKGTPKGVVCASFNAG